MISLDVMKLGYLSHSNNAGDIARHEKHAGRISDVDGLVDSHPRGTVLSRE